MMNTIPQILNSIKEISGRISRSHYELRHCSRCGSALSDPASWTRGTGPICANKDTALFAKTIPADYPSVGLHSMAVDSSTLPLETVEVWEALKNIINNNTFSAIEQSGSVTNATGANNSPVVKIIDWMLSFKMGLENKEHLIQIVKCLGFPGVAGVLSGKASTGEAKIWFENGKLQLLGSSNKLAYYEFKKIPGVVTPKYRGDKSPYMVSPEHWEKFLEIAREFYPCFEGEEARIVEQAKAWLAVQPKSTPAKPGLPTATFLQRSEDFTLNFQFIRGVSERLINELKGTVPPSERTYDPASYTWACKKHHYDAVKKLFGETYNCIERSSNLVTPNGIYKNYSGKSATYRHSWHRG